MNDDNLREALLLGAKEGHFLRAIQEHLNVDWEKLVKEVASIHNDELVDVVTIFEELDLTLLDKVEFFRVLHLFEQALPHLNIPVDRTMRCVLKLFHESGQGNMASGSIFNSFVEFCSMSTSRSEEAFALIETNPETLADLLPATVAAGSRLDARYYLTKLEPLIHHSNIEIRRQAIFSLGAFHPLEEESTTEIIIFALEQAVEKELDDEILASAIRSALAIFQKNKTLEDRVTNLIINSFDKGGDSAFVAASEMLRYCTKEIPIRLQELLLVHFNPEEEHTTALFDFGISTNLLKHNAPEWGLIFLENLLIRYHGKIKMDAFSATISEIGKDAPLINSLVTRWLLTGTVPLCEAAVTLCESTYDIHGSRSDYDFFIEVDETKINPIDFVHVIFLARKAIGYFFMRPKVAASVLISLLHHSSDDDTREMLGELLFDPLLLSYPGGLRRYLEVRQHKESGEVKETILVALRKINEYLDVLHAVPDLAALHAPLSQREVYHRYESESMANAMRVAERNSFFSRLFARSTLLYGNKSINYVRGLDGGQHRTELPLNSHSVSVEFPRMENIDPFGLDYMLRVLRSEKLRS